MYHELNNIAGSKFKIPDGVTNLDVWNCPQFTTVPDGVTNLDVRDCPLYVKR